MARLNQQQKIFIVERLACFDSPTEVQAAVKESFGIDVTLPQLSTYDPNTAMGKELAKKLKLLFEETRKRFIDDTAGIASSHKAYRIRRLEAMARKAEASKNMKLAAALYEQIAKECGGAYTNKREISGPNGGAIEHQVRSLSDFYNQGA